MKYKLRCLDTGDLIEDAYTLKYTDNALLQAKFNGPMEVKPLEGVWKYLDWSSLAMQMKTPRIYDGRRVLDLDSLKSMGWQCYAVGRPLNS